MRVHPMLSWVATFCIAATIIALTLTPGVTALDLPGFDLWDKAQHAIAFAFLVLPNACFNRPALPITMFAATLLGAGIELIQPFVGREASLGDFAADMAGIALGAALGILLLQSIQRLQTGRAG